jgi:hypothetical protein
MGQGKTHSRSDYSRSLVAPTRVGSAVSLLFLGLVALLLVGASFASAAVSTKGIVGYFGASGTAAGQMTTPRGVAVNQGSGNVYAVDGAANNANNRIVEFNSSGGFLRAFGADVVASGPDQANEIQAVDVNAASGNFTLTFNGQTTGTIAATAGAATVQAELNALSTIGGLSPAGSVTVTDGPGNAGGTSPYKITFGGSLAATNVNQVSAANVSLAGGSPATVITPGTVNNGEIGFEICLPTSDACKAGAVGATGGAMNTPQGLAVNQTSGDVYVTEQGGLRVDQFDASGNFIRAFGQDVVATGFPDNSPAASAVQTLTVPGAVTGGTFKLSFGGQSTGWSASGTLTCDGASTTVTTVSTFAGLSLGEEISSSPVTCIQPGTTVSAFNAGTGTITLSQATENNANGGVASLSANLPFNVSAANLREALEKLSTIGTGNVTVAGGPGATNPFTITFAGALKENPEPLIGVNSAGLTGGTATIANAITGASGFEVCAAAAADVCKTGVSASTGGAFKSTFNGYPAIAPATAANPGDVLVADPVNQRVQEFGANGAFVRAFGLNIVGAGPDNNGITNFEVCSAAAGDACVIGTAGTGSGAFAAATPTRVAEDASSNLYTVEPTGNFRVQKFVMPAPAGVAITASGAFDPIDIPGTSAAAPIDVAVNPTANSNVLVTRAFAAASTPSCPITGTSSPAESRVLEISSGGTLEGTHGICAGLTSANGLAARQSTGDLYLSSTLTASRLYVLNTGQPAAPAASITNVSGVGAHVATVSAFINPNGPELPYGNETTYKFEYKRSADPTYTPLGSGEASAGNRNVSRLIAQPLEGLRAATSYDVRLVATKPFGSGTASTTVSFSTAAAAPDVTLPAAVRLQGTTAYLQGTVNPNNSTTNYRFEYVEDARFAASGFADATRKPSPDASAGSGVDAVGVYGEASGLEPGTTYDMRLVATNGTGMTASAPVSFTIPAGGGCPNEAIREAQKSEALPGSSSYLPDCMALEMVSPPQKFQQGVTPGLGIAAGGEIGISPNDDRVLFIAKGALAETPILFEKSGDPYVATRGDAGWTTSYTSAPAEFSKGKTTYGYGPDYSHWFHVVSTEEQFKLGNGQAFLGGLGGSFFARSPLLTPVGSVNEQNALATYQGAAADGSHLYFQIGGSSTLFNGRYFLTDPEPGPGTSTAARRNTYVAGLDPNGQPSLALLARDAQGRVWGGNCGTRLGGDSEPSATFGGNATGQNVRNQGAISTDGSRVYFSARPAQPATGNCSATASSTVNKLRILKREETASGAQISELISSQCSRVSPPCDATDGDDLYNGASVDGSKVYFTTTRQLANSDLDTGTPTTPCSPTTAVAGCDLYLYDATLPAGQRLIQVSAGDASDPTPGSGAKVYNSVAAISGDGSRVYFVAQGVLTIHPNPEGVVAVAGERNLYLYERNEANPNGHTAFIGAVSSGDQGILWGGDQTWRDGAYPVPVGGKDNAGNEVGGDGHTLAFETKASLTAADIDEGLLDVYRYDSTADPATLECVSCRPGGADSESFAATSYLKANNGGTGPGPDFAQSGRWVSEDGETVVFFTSEGLVAGEASGVNRGYLWRQGILYPLPGTQAPPTARPSAAVSADGSEVAFQTGSNLLAQDGDSVPDLYVIRAGGGYRTPVTEICTGEKCQEPFAAQPGDQASGSEANRPSGNVPERPACKKGFVRKHGKCVRRRRKHHKQRSHHPHHDGRRIGGSK